MEQFLQAETLVIELLLIVSLVALAVRRLRIPYTVALVVAGLIITTQSPIEIDLTPELILTLFVPPLVFEAAFHLNLIELRRNFAWIFTLAVPGVILTMLIVGSVLAWATPIGWPLALLFGALISATDPVAVVALFRTLGVPKRLATLVEGESLMNDGTAIVVFNLMLTAAIAGRFDWTTGLLDFLRISIGGLAVGLILGWLIAKIIERIDDYLIETTLTTVLAFGSYLLAERMGVSGVLAVVAAGLVNGNIGPRGMSPTTRIVLYNFWEYVAFLANSLVFLIIGLDVNIQSLAAAWQPILFAIGAVLLARVVLVYGLGWIVHRFAEPIPFRWQAILGWGGLRGAISLALALSLPAALGPGREQLRVMAFGVALFTLLIQATTMRPLVNALRIVTRSDSRNTYDLQHARLVTLRSAEAQLARLHDQGLISPPAWDRLKRDLDRRLERQAEEVRRVLLTEPALEAADLDRASHELAKAQRSALQELRRDGMIADDVFDKLVTEIDVSVIESNDAEAAEPTGEDRLAYLEETLLADSAASGRNVAELALPPETVLVSIRRGTQMIIPRGSTTLLAGDRITALCRNEQLPKVRELLAALPTAPVQTPVEPMEKPARKTK